MRVKKITPRYFNLYERSAHNDLDAGVDFIKRNADMKKNYYAFTCLQFHPTAKKLLCGTTNFSNDVLHTFDPATKEFQSLGYAQFGRDEFEIKCHRSLAVGKDGKVYGATSCLHDIPDRLKGPGGKVFSYDLNTKKFELLCIPKQHDYIQTISLDPEREMIYGFTYPVFEFFAYSIREKKVKYLQYMQSITHLSAIDDAGGYWGTWGFDHKFFRYDPVSNSVNFFKHGLPLQCHSLMYKNAGPVDMMLNAGDGSLYITSEIAELYRLNPKTAEVAYLGRPFASNRMPGLTVGPKGLLFGAGGIDDDTQLCSFDRETGRFENLGHIKATEGGNAGSKKGADSRVPAGTTCFRTHDLIAVGNTLYCGETDNPKRGDFLWEIELSD
ncbi:MAG: hypothetical protein ACREJ2_11315 [Planctomycetota bacterium]